jgi:hypothetical protein
MRILLTIYASGTEHRDSTRLHGCLSETTALVYVGVSREVPVRPCSYSVVHFVAAALPCCEGL